MQACASSPPSSRWTATSGSGGVIWSGRTSREALTARLCRIMGGGSYARHSPFGFWAQDAKALGFLRPPWNLAHVGAYEESWERIRTC